MARPSSCRGGVARHDAVVLASPAADAFGVDLIQQTEVTVKQDGVDRALRLTAASRCAL